MRVFCSLKCHIISADKSSGKCCVFVCSIGKIKIISRLSIYSSFYNMEFSSNSATNYHHIGVDPFFSQQFIDSCSTFRTKISSLTKWKHCLVNRPKCVRWIEFAIGLLPFLFFFLSVAYYICDSEFVCVCVVISCLVLNAWDHFSLCIMYDSHINYMLAGKLGLFLNRS